MSEHASEDVIQWPQVPDTIEVRISLQVQFPGMPKPWFVEGMKLMVDKYMYERYREIGELDRWLHHQAVTYVMDNSVARRVAIDRGPM